MESSVTGMGTWRAVLAGLVVSGNIVQLLTGIGVVSALLKAGPGIWLNIHS